VWGVGVGDWREGGRFLSFALTGDQDTRVKQGMSHTLALPFTLKNILRQKKNYENSNISPCKNIILRKSSKKNQNPSRY